MMAENPCVRMTDAPLPISTSVSVVSGPRTTSSPMVLAPWIWVCGWIVTSRPSVTSASIHVVAGSTTVTPARIQRSTMRRLSSAPSLASWTRSLTPSVCHTSSTRCALTRRPSARTIPRTSVRYFSPCALSVPTWASLAQDHGVERVQAGVDLGDLQLLGGGVLLLDDAGDRAVRRANDAAITEWVGQRGGDHGGGAPARGVRLEQSTQGLSGE